MSATILTVNINRITYADDETIDCLSVPVDLPEDPAEQSRPFVGIPSDIRQASLEYTRHAQSLNLAPTTIPALIVAFLAVSPSACVRAQDLDTVEICAVASDGTNPSHMIVEFLDPDSGELLMDADGLPRKHEVRDQPCVLGAGAVATENHPSFTPARMIIFPNPANGPVTARWTLESPTRSASVAVFDLLGREILRSSVRDFQPGQYEASLADVDLAAGVYIVRLISDLGVLASGTFVDVGGGSSAGGTITINGTSAPPDSAPTSTTDREASSPGTSSSEAVSRQRRWYGKTAGRVRVRITAEDHLQVDQTLQDVSDGDRFTFGLKPARTLEIYALDMTRHRTAVAEGSLVLVELRSGLALKDEFDTLPVRIAAPSDSVGLRIDAEGFTSGLQAVRSGEPGDYSGNLLGANLNPDTFPTLHIPPTMDGPVTAGIIPDRMLVDDAYVDYIAAFSLFFFPLGSQNNGHTNYDLEHPYFVANQGPSDADSVRIREIVPVSPRPTDQLMDSVMVALDRFAAVVNERTFYEYRFRRSGVFDEDYDWRITLADTVVGIGDYGLGVNTENGEMFKGTLLFPESSDMGDRSQLTVDEAMIMIATMRLLGDDNEDASPEARDFFLGPSGADYSTTVRDWMGIQAFIRRTQAGSRYDTNPVRGLFHTVPSSSGKRYSN